MSEDKNEQEAPREAAVEEERRNGNKECGNQQMTTILAVVAVLMAGYAVVTTSSNVGLSLLESKLDNIESKVSSNSNQLASLNEDVQKNRSSLVQARLREVLLSIQEIKGMSDAGTREAVSEAENILLSLTPDAAPPAEAEQPIAAEESVEPEPQTETLQETSEPAEQTADAEDTISDNVGHTVVPADAGAETTPEEQPAAGADPGQDSDATADEAPAQPL